MENNQSLQDVCGEIKELADKASELVGALNTKDEQTKIYAKKCKVFSERLTSLRNIVLNEFGEEAKDVKTTTLVKRLIAERNSSRRELEKLAYEIKNSKSVQLSAEIDPAFGKDIGRMLKDILSQSPQAQFSDWAHLKTIKGQGDTIRRQNEKIDQQNAKIDDLIKENTVLQGQVATYQIENEKLENMFLKQKEQAEFDEKFHQQVTGVRKALHAREVNKLREQITGLENEVASAKSENAELREALAGLEAELKKTMRYKLSTALKNFKLKVKSMFNKSNSDEELGERE